MPRGASGFTILRVMSRGQVRGAGDLRLRRTKRKPIDTRHEYVVTRRDLRRAYELRSQGHPDGAIAKALGISTPTYSKHRLRFETYFRTQARDRRLVNPVGRPRGSYKVDPETIDLGLVRDLVLLGMTEKRIARALGVTQDTFITYKRLYPELQQAVDNAKTMADARVIRALYERATGYEHRDTHFASYLGQITSEEYTKHYPPDVQAAIAWLVNSGNVDWKKEPEPRGSDNRGDILAALDRMNRDGEELPDA